MRRFVVALTALAVLACSGPGRHERETTPPPPPPPEEPDAGPPEPLAPEVYEDTAAPDGPACERAGDCEDGLACRGPAGCMAPWACGERHECEPATIAYCDCDGQTFYAQSGCAGRPYLHVGACAVPNADEIVSLGIPDGDEPITEADRTCTSSSECRGWQTCFGPPGCRAEFRCELVRRCRRDRVEYCSCDGETFRASSNCPGRPYLHRGACDDETAIASVEPEVESPDAGAASSSGPPDAGARTSRMDAGPRDAGTTDAGRAGVAVASAGVDAGGRDAGPDAGAVLASTEPVEGACRSNADCRRPRSVCTGPPGCGFTWTCERPPAEGCNRDTQVFCDCSGETFRASMNCPGQPFAHRGSCEIDRLLDLAGGGTH